MLDGAGWPNEWNTLNVTMLQSFAGMFRAFRRAFRLSAMYQNLILLKLLCTNMSLNLYVRNIRIVQQNKENAIHFNLKIDWCFALIPFSINFPKPWQVNKENNSLRLVQTDYSSQPIFFWHWLNVLQFPGSSQSHYFGWHEQGKNNDQ